MTNEQLKKGQQLNDKIAAVKTIMQILTSCMDEPYAYKVKFSYNGPHPAGTIEREDLPMDMVEQLLKIQENKYFELCTEFEKL